MRNRSGGGLTRRRRFRARKDSSSIDLPVPREPSRKHGFRSSRAPILRASGGANVLAKRSGRSSKYSARIRRNGFRLSARNASDTMDETVVSGRKDLHKSSRSV